MFINFRTSKNRLVAGQNAFLKFTASKTFKNESWTVFELRKSINYSVKCISEARRLLKLTVYKTTKKKTNVKTFSNSETGFTAMFE